MDKFGIFNLLNSLLNNKNANSNEEKEQNDGNSFSSMDFLNGLISSYKGSQKEKPTAQPQQKKSVPLQSSMLYTMNSHDKFINRVKEKSNAKQNQPTHFP